VLRLRGGGGAYFFKVLNKLTNSFEVLHTGDYDPKLIDLVPVIQKKFGSLQLILFFDGEKVKPDKMVKKLSETTTV
jgi:hypothetical protein